MLEQVKEAAAERLKLPGDVALGEVLVSFVGRSAALVENYRSILLYDGQTVKLLVARGKLVFHGKGLRIEYYNRDEMKISGRIQSMEFVE